MNGFSFCNIPVNVKINHILFMRCQNTILALMRNHYNMEDKDRERQE